MIAVITLDTSSKDVHRQMLHHLRENETVREHALRSSVGQRSSEGGSSAGKFKSVTGINEFILNNNGLQTHLTQTLGQQ